MQAILETHPITFTADLGTVMPAVVDTENGVAVTTFTACQTLGQATSYATNGEITGTVHIQLYSTQAPAANFTPTPVTGFAPLTVYLTDTSVGGATSWLWDFGDGSTSTQQNPVHVYNEPGSYINQPVCQ